MQITENVCCLEMRCIDNRCKLRDKKLLDIVQEAAANATVEPAQPEAEPVSSADPAKEARKQARDVQRQRKAERRESREQQALASAQDLTQEAGIGQVDCRPLPVESSESSYDTYLVSTAGNAKVLNCMQLEI